MEITKKPAVKFEILKKKIIVDGPEPITLLAAMWSNHEVVFSVQNGSVRFKINEKKRIVIDSLKKIGENTFAFKGESRNIMTEERKKVRGEYNPEQKNGWMSF